MSTLQPAPCDDGTTTTTSSSSKSSSKGGVNMSTFENRYSIFKPTAEECKILASDISPIGVATIRLKPLCDWQSDGYAEINITCDLLAGAIAITRNKQSKDIPSQCPGGGRTVITDYTADIKFDVYFDSAMKNQAIAAILYPTKLGNVTANGTNYAARGIGTEVLNRVLPRYFVEIVPYENNGTPPGILIYPSCELDFIDGGTSFEKGNERKVSIMIKARMPDYTTNAAFKAVELALFPV
jgi:hypothetical protein